MSILSQEGSSGSYKGGEDHDMDCDCEASKFLKKYGQQIKKIVKKLGTTSLKSLELSIHRLDQSSSESSSESDASDGKKKEKKSRKDEKKKKDKTKDGDGKSMGDKERSIGGKSSKVSKGSKVSKKQGSTRYESDEEVDDDGDGSQRVSKATSKKSREKDGKDKHKDDKDKHRDDKDRKKKDKDKTKKDKKGKSKKDKKKGSDQDDEDEEESIEEVDEEGNVTKRKKRKEKKHKKGKSSKKSHAGSEGSGSEESSSEESSSEGSSSEDRSSKGDKSSGEDSDVSETKRSQRKDKVDGKSSKKDKSSKTSRDVREGKGSRYDDKDGKSSRYDKDKDGKSSRYDKDKDGKASETGGDMKDGKVSKYGSDGKVIKIDEEGGGSDTRAGDRKSGYSKKSGKRSEYSRRSSKDKTGLEPGSETSSASIEIRRITFDSLGDEQEKLVKQDDVCIGPCEGADEDKDPETFIHGLVETMVDSVLDKKYEEQFKTCSYINLIDSTTCTCKGLDVCYFCGGEDFYGSFEDFEEPETEKEQIESRDQYRSQQELYIQDHRIDDMFNFMVSNLLVREPDNPIKYLISLLDKCILYRQRTIEPPLLFSEKHLESLFKSLDPMGYGCINVEQYKTAMLTLGLKNYNPFPDINKFGFVAKKTFIEETSYALIANLDDIIRIRHPKTPSDTFSHDYMNNSSCTCDMATNA